MLCILYVWDLGAVLALVKRGTDVKKADLKGRTPLHFAACRGDSNVGKYVEMFAWMDLCNRLCLERVFEVVLIRLNTVSCTCEHVCTMTVVLQLVLEVNFFRSCIQRKCSTLNNIWSHVNFLLLMYGF